MNDNTKRQTEAMLSKFMSGLTSLEEEQELAKIMRRNDIPEEWNDYKEMFKFFAEGMPEDSIYGRSMKPTNSEISNKNVYKKYLNRMKWAAILVGMLFSLTLLYYKDSYHSSSNNSASETISKSLARAEVSKKVSSNNISESETAYMSGLKLANKKLDRNKGLENFPQPEKEKAEKLNSVECLSARNETEKEVKKEIEQVEIYYADAVKLIEDGIIELNETNRIINEAELVRRQIDIGKYDCRIAISEEGEMIIVENNNNYLSI